MLAAVKVTGLHQILVQLAISGDEIADESALPSKTFELEGNWSILCFHVPSECTRWGLDCIDGKRRSVALTIVEDVGPE